MLIEVTAEDIDHGISGHCEQCPVAWAVERATGHTAYVLINVCFVGGKLYALPGEAIRFIFEFDNSRPVKPFSFELLPTGI